MALVDRALRGAAGCVLAGVGLAAQAPEWHLETALGAGLVAQKNEPIRETTFRLEAGAGLYRDLGAKWRLGCGATLTSPAPGKGAGTDPFLVIHAADLVFQPWGTWAFRARAGFIRLFREHPSYGISLGAAFDYPLTPTTALSLAYTWAEADMSTSVPGDPGKDPKDAFDGVSLVWRKRF